MDQNRWVCAGLGVLGLLMAGCGREEPAVYEVAKETPPPAAKAAGDPHAGMDVHGSLRQPAFRYETPAGWTVLPPSGMSPVRFQVTGAAGGQADVAAMSLPGGAAKDLDVVNIFRERLQLPPVDGEALKALAKSISVGAAGGRLYDLAGVAGATNAPVRLLVAVAEQGSAAWYFRMTGDPGVVEAQAGAFESFLKSVVFEAGSGATEATASGAGSGGASGGGAMSSGGSGASAGSAGLPAWEVPEGWQSASPTPMVMARFLLGQGEAKAELTVSSFPGDVGGLVANVNRWRGQIGLAPVGDAEARQQAPVVDLSGVEGHVVDLTGERAGKKVRLLGVVQPKGGSTWFYKLVGDETVVGREKESLLKFVRSAR